MKRIIDIILWEEGFYPFSMKFNLAKSIEKNEQLFSTLEEDSTSKSVFKYSEYFNWYFKGICKELQEVLSKSAFTKSTFIELIIADLNRKELIVTEDTKQILSSGETYDSNSQGNEYIQKPEFQNIKEPVWGLIDSMIDTAVLNLNYLKYVKFKNEIETKDEISQVEVIKVIGLVGSKFNAIKQAYDKILWREGFIESDDSVIKLKSDHNNLMLDNVGLTRLTRNVSNIQNELHFNLEEYKTVLKSYHKTRHFQIIKSIEERDGELVVKYQAKAKTPTETFISFIAPILTYYPFIHTKVITKFDNLTILDLVNLFSILCDFVMVLPIPEYEDTEVKDLTKFKRFNPQVRKTVLLSHFIRTTKYSENQILIFFNLLIQEGEEHNLYLFPIYENGEYYFFSHANIKRANMLYLVDKWLDMGNCNLAERGFTFEDYIKSFLKNEKLNEFAKFSLIDQSKFTFLDENKIRFEEEIDLVIKTETTIILAEIKCTTYPLEPNDFYSSFQTIKKAKNQIVRKTKFIEDNWNKFEHLLGKKGERTIQNIIIVNFPHNAGRIIEDIPIADFYLFLSYFRSGKLVNVKIERGVGLTKEEILYYDSVKSFENNFSKFFHNPIPISDIISRQSIEEYEVSINGTEPKAISERVVYTEKTFD